MLDDEVRMIDLTDTVGLQKAWGNARGVPHSGGARATRLLGAIALAPAVTHAVHVRLDNFASDTDVARMRGGGPRRGDSLYC
jgi:hypothetical protein